MSTSLILSPVSHRWLHSMQGWRASVLRFLLALCLLGPWNLAAAVDLNTADAQQLQQIKILTEDDWLVFKSLFLNIHPDFYKNFKVNVVGVAYTYDGSIKYTRDIDYNEPNNFVFTSDMRYLLLNNDLKFQEIYDLDEDTFVYNRLGAGRYNSICHLYISPDLEYSIILEAGIQSCGINWGDSQRLRYRLSTYNFKEQKNGSNCGVRKRTTRTCEAGKSCGKTTK